MEADRLEGRPIKSRVESRNLWSQPLWEHRSQVQMSCK